MIDFVIKVDLFKSVYLLYDLIKVVNIQSIFLCTEIEACISLLEELQRLSLCFCFIYF